MITKQQAAAYFPQTKCILRTLLFLLLVLVVAGLSTPLRADTVLSVTGPMNVPSSLNSRQILAVSWTSTHSYSAVSISAMVGMYPFTGTAYLTSRIGPGTTAAANQLAVSTFSAPTAFNSINLFSGLSLEPGTYYIVLSPTAGGGAWAGTNSPTVKTVAGVSVGGAELFAQNPAPYPPASVFQMGFGASLEFELIANSPLAPVITGSNPQSAGGYFTVAAGGPEFDVKLYGLNFANGAVAQWTANGIMTVLNTDFNNSGQLTAHVPAALIVSPVNAGMVVKGPTGEVSNVWGANVLLQPILFGTNPQGPGGIFYVAAAGAADVGLNGQNFVNGSVAEWIAQGVITQLTTSFYSPVYLSAHIPELLLASTGKAAIVVKNPNGAVSATQWPVSITPRYGGNQSFSKNFDLTWFEFPYGCHTEIDQGTVYLSDTSFHLYGPNIGSQLPLSDVAGVAYDDGSVKVENLRKTDHDQLSVTKYANYVSYRVTLKACTGNGGAHRYIRITLFGEKP